MIRSGPKLLTTPHRSALHLAGADPVHGFAWHFEGWRAEPCADRGGDALHGRLGRTQRSGSSGRGAGGVAQVVPEGLPHTPPSEGESIDEGIQQVNSCVYGFPVFASHEIKGRVDEGEAFGLR